MRRAVLDRLARAFARRRCLHDGRGRRRGRGDEPPPATLQQTRFLDMASVTVSLAVSFNEYIPA
jgi:hypothetical protein